MPKINLKLSEDAHRILTDYQKAHGISCQDDALDALLLEYAKGRRLFK